MNRLPRVITLLFPAVLIFVNSYFVVAQRESPYRLPAGTRIKLKMASEIDSMSASVGDTFVARLDAPIVNRSVAVLAAGTEFEGRITTVKRAGPAGRDARIEFVIEQMIVRGGNRRSIEAATITQFRPRSSRTVTALSIIGGTAVGALIGYAADPGVGALIGAGIGAGVGTGAAIASKGKQLRIKEDQEFEIELKQDLILPLLEN